MDLSGVASFFGGNRSNESSTGRASRLGEFMSNIRSSSGEPPAYTEYAETYMTSGHNQPPRPQVQESLVIAVMGPTGSGKSTLISRLSGQSVQIGHGLKSCTQDPEEVPCKIGDKNVILVDTPGFNDTYRPDIDVLRSLVDWMKECYSEKQLSGIIYLHDITDTRMYGSSLKNLQMFRRLCGTDNLDHVTLTTTKWGKCPESEALAREEELRSTPRFWGIMISDGARCRRLENTVESARSLVEEILRPGHETFTPRLQEEIVEQGMQLSATAAGTFLNDALIEQAKKHQEELATIREEQQRANEKHDLVMQKALKEERARLDQEIARKQEEQRTLNLDEMGALQKRIKDLERAAKTNGEFINKQGFWHLFTWKCLICKKQTEVEGNWTCPKCKLTQKNVLHWDGKKF